MKSVVDLDYANLSAYCSYEYSFGVGVLALFLIFASRLGLNGQIS
jgi:hypothetical protein